MKMAFQSLFPKGRSCQPAVAASFVSKVDARTKRQQFASLSSGAARQYFQVDGTPRPLAAVTNGTGGVSANPGLAGQGGVPQGPKDDNNMEKGIDAQEHAFPGNAFPGNASTSVRIEIGTMFQKSFNGSLFEGRVVEGPF